MYASAPKNSNIVTKWYCSQFVFIKKENCSLIWSYIQNEANHPDALHFLFIYYNHL